MNKILAEAIDKLALYQLHKEKSIISRFYLNQDTKTIDYTTFYKTPNVPCIDFIQNEIQNHYEVGKYYFQSEITNNNESNNNVCGIYRKNIVNNEATNIILVHGWRMNSLDRLDDIYLKKFMQQGYNMYYFTMPYHFERISEDCLYNGELMVSADVDRTLLSIQQAVSDLRALIKWIKNNSLGKVIVIGISLGGFLSNLLSIAEKDIDGLISAFYANSLAYSVWKTIPGKYIKNDFVKNSYTYEQLKLSWDIITPSSFKPLISRDKILLFNGVYDKAVNFVSIKV